MKLNLKKWLFLILSLSLSQWVSGAEVRVSVKNSIQDFHLITENAGWVLMGQRLYFTHAKGDTWVEITPNLNHAAVQAVTFLDTQFGWAVLAKPEEDAIAYSVVKTIDGGNNWEVTVNDIKLDTPPAAIYLHFINPSVGWIVLKDITSSNFSVGALFKTTDGGSTWTPLNIPIGEPVQFISETVGWTAGGAAGNELYKTEDGGQTWIPQADRNIRSSQNGHWSYQLPVFQNSQEGVLPVLVAEEDSSYVAVFSTQDAGYSWKRITEVPLAPGSAATATPMAVLDSQHWVVASPPASHLRSSPEDNKEVITALSMATATTGWAMQSAGWKQDDLNYASETKLLRTTDGGQTWHPINVPQPATTAMSFLSAEARLTRGANRAFQGPGFDICEIPTLNQLQAWTQSPYRAVNLYIGGGARSCANRALTASYVSTIAQQGWKLIPTWVGPQATCYAKSTVKINANNPYQNGVEEANAAITAMKALGLNSTIIYYDMEQYNVTNSVCLNTTRSFLSGWNTTLQGKGYLSGLYTSGSGFTETTNNLSPQFDAIWVAHWNLPGGQGGYDNTVTVQTKYVPNNQWISKRIRQYAGDFLATYGGVKLKIDANVIDGIVVDAYELVTSGATSEMQSFNSMGIMLDISDPNAHITREQAWTLIFRTLAYVKNGRADENLVDTTTKSKITNFSSPSSYVTRQELLTMLVRALAVSNVATSTAKTPPYQDMPTDLVFRDAIVRAYNAGIIGENSRIYPMDPVSRHRFATWGTKFMTVLKAKR